MGIAVNLTERRKQILEDHIDRTRLLEEGLNETAPELLEEIQGIADGSNQSYKDILFLNAVGEGGDAALGPPLGMRPLGMHLSAFTLIGGLALCLTR